MAAESIGLLASRRRPKCYNFPMAAHFDTAHYIRKLAVGGTISELGGKGFRLAELYKCGLPVPEGFVLTTRAFDDFLSSNHLSAGQHPTPRTFVPDHILDLASSSAQRLLGDSPLAIRSSATLEDTGAFTFAGVFASLVNIRVHYLEDALLEIYRSICTPQATDYLVRNNIPLADLRMAVVVQRFIKPEYHGICFTLDPLTGDPVIIVEMFASQGSLHARYRGSTPDDMVMVWPREQELQADLSGLARDVASLSLRSEKLFVAPQDVEWVLGRNDKLYLVQSRDILLGRSSSTQRVPAQLPAEELPYIQGVALSAGIATGPVRKLLSDMNTQEALAVVRPGDLVIGHALRIDHLPALARASGVVVADPSVLSHVAIRAREINVPCVGGVENPLELFREDDRITIDGNRGRIYWGSVQDVETKPHETRSTYFNPDKVHALNIDHHVLLYERLADEVLVYLNRVGDPSSEEAAREELAPRLSMEKSKIKIDRNAVWEGTIAPNVVYVQYQTIEHLKQDALLERKLKQGIEIASKLDAAKLLAFVREQDREAKALFRKSLRYWDRYETMGRREDAENAATFLDAAKQLSGNVVGVALLDVYCIYFLEKATRPLQDLYGVTFSSLFSASSQVRRPYTERAAKLLKGKGTVAGRDWDRLIQLLRYSRALSMAKNRRLEALSYKGRNALHMIEEFYQEGFEALVAKYGW